MAKKYWKFVIFISFIFHVNLASGARCDRRPYAAITQSSPSDGRFKLEVVGAQSYVPEQLYVVRLFRTDDESLFTEFMITAEGEQRRNPLTRRTMVMDAGLMSPMDENSRRTTNRAGCFNTVEQQNSSPKDAVEVYWTAPKSDSGCVTIHAMLAVSDVEWFEDGSSLSQRICEDLSQPDDISPIINKDCSICEDAKYELSFTGLWSRNTHPVQFPDNDENTAFSVIIGASHSIEWSPWIAGGMASDGLKELAEYANASKLEKEIFEQIPESNVRTLIKGKGHRGFGKINLPAYSYFRTDKSHHLISVAVAISPSPDWFLGVSRFELCTADNKWLDERELNLFPWDAGTDNGVTYESSNNPTYPQDAIERVKMSSNDRNSPFFELDMKDMHPFGRLHLRLIRTYDRECEETTEESETPAPDGDKGEGSEEPSEPEDPSSESPIAIDPDSPEDCPMSQWTEWTSCDGPCVNGRIEGFRNRERYFMVDGEPIDKYDDENPDGKEFDIPEHCNSIETFEVEKCVEKTCEEQDEPTANRRVMGPVLPGHRWSAKRNTDLKGKQPPYFLPVKDNYA